MQRLADLGQGLRNQHLRQSDYNANFRFLEDHQVAFLEIELPADLGRLGINRQIARRSAELWRSLFKQPNPDRFIRDILIAATAEYYQMDIVTENVKHFEQIDPEKIRIIKCGEV